MQTYIPSYVSKWCFVFGHSAMTIAIPTIIIYSIHIENEFKIASHKFPAHNNIIWQHYLVVYYNIVCVALIIAATPPPPPPHFPTPQF